MRLATDDQLALVGLASRPAREASRDDFLGERIKLGPALFELGFDLDLEFVERAAADARIDVIAGLDQRRYRQSGWKIEDPVFDLPVFADQDDQRAARFELYEFDVL